MATWWDDEGEVVAIRPSRPLNREPHVRVRMHTGMTSNNHPDDLETLPRKEAPCASARRANGRRSQRI
jgi:hypothetical protein